MPLKREMVFNHLIERDQELFIKRQRNHDLIFLNRLKDDARLEKLRMTEAIYRCPVFGRFKVSKRQLQTIAEAMKEEGPRRLVVSVAGRHFQRHDFGRWLHKEIAALGYEFTPETEDEVWLFCIDESYYFGIPQFKAFESRGPREEEREGSLPPSVAAAMAFASIPREDDIVLDPVCGSGTLLAEFHGYQPTARLTGFDIDPKAIATAKRNLQTLNKVGLELRAQDSRQTNLPDACISLTLANLPFGKQFGSTETNPVLYRELIKESVRLGNEKWRGIFLTSDTEALLGAVRELSHLQTETLFKVQIRGENATAFRVSRK